ncbi:MAG: hypothetical protein LC753_08445 [Acidobacteria bacterium]|nr:hypothetical protein [Acidobacteriota bacterium]
MAKRRTVPHTSDKLFLRAATEPGSVDPAVFPFTIPAFSHGIDINF